MKTRKIRRTRSPARYGTKEVPVGGTIDVPVAVAGQLVRDGSGWEFAPEPPASPDVSTPTESTPPRRRPSGDK